MSRSLIPRTAGPLLAQAGRYLADGTPPTPANPSPPALAAERTRAFHRGASRCAILSSAMGAEYERQTVDGEPFTVSGDVAIAETRGPLVHHVEVDPWTGKVWWDSYDAIRERVAAAIASGASTVMLKLDSPGGEVSGVFETARGIRAMLLEAGKASVAYVDAQACSAAYALACACDQIVTVEEGILGSIGVIAELYDQTAADAAMGLAVHLVTSGARKADGHPHGAVTDDVVAAVQRSVDTEAGIFMGWVSERRGLGTDAIAGLQASHFHGEEAVGLGLADAVVRGGFAEALAVVANLKSAAPSGQSQGSKSMAKMSEQIRKMLLDAAAEDSDEGKKAKKALEAYDSEDAPPPEKKDEEKPKEPDGDEGEDEADDDAEDEAAASATTSAEDEEKKDDAKRCEDEAKAEDDEAKAAARKAEESDAEARKACASGDAKAASRALKAVDRFRSAARSHAAQARILRNQAVLFSRTAAKPAAKPATGAKSVASKIAAGTAALAARGTATEPGKGKASDGGRKTIDQVPEDIRRAAGILTESAPGDLVRYDSAGMSIGARFSDPKTAREYLASQRKVGA